MKKPLSNKDANVKQAGMRALKEAEARRNAGKSGGFNDKSGAKELGGRDGPEPTRYGDWERKGIVSDF